MKVQYEQCSPRHPSGTAQGTALASGQPARKKLKSKTKRRKVVRLRQTEGLCPDFCVIQADGAAEATGEAEIVFVVTNPPSYHRVLGHSALTPSTCWDSQRHKSSHLTINPRCRRNQQPCSSPHTCVGHAGVLVSSLC